MGILDQITPLILTWNEENNIGRVLEKLHWAREIVVLDSGSTDRTRTISEAYPSVRFVIRPFDNHASQWNYGLSGTGITSAWVLALDADYVLTDQFIDELKTFEVDSNMAGYRVQIRYCINGRPLSGTLYPPVISLYKRDHAYYVQDGHTQRVVLDGPVSEMKHFLLHDDRKPLARWLMAQDRYAQLECDFLLDHRWRHLHWPDRLRKLLVVTPWLTPLYCMTVGRGFLDGWHGLYYAIQRGIAEGVLSLKLIEARFRCHISVGTKEPK